MGQFKSFQEANVERRLIKAEQEILKLKAIQSYDTQQINYTYQSNTLSIPAYRLYSDQQYSESYGILATLTFTSWFPNIFPRIACQTHGGVLVGIRTEYLSENQVRVMIHLVDTIIPMSQAHPFTTTIFARSNTPGVLKLEQTYVITV